MGVHAVLGVSDRPCFIRRLCLKLATLGSTRLASPHDSLARAGLRSHLQPLSRSAQLRHGSRPATHPRSQRDACPTAFFSLLPLSRPPPSRLAHALPLCAFATSARPRPNTLGACVATLWFSSPSRSHLARLHRQYAPLRRRPLASLACSTRPAPPLAPQAPALSQLWLSHRRQAYLLGVRRLSSRRLTSRSSSRPPPSRAGSTTARRSAFGGPILATVPTISVFRQLVARGGRCLAPLR